MTLDGTDDYVDLSDNLIAGLDSVTVAMDVIVSPSQSGNYFIWGFGNTAGDGAGNGYLYSTGNNYRGGIATGNWTTHVLADAPAPTDRHRRAEHDLRCCIIDGGAELSRQVPDQPQPMDSM